MSVRGPLARPRSSLAGRASRLLALLLVVAVLCLSSCTGAMGGASAFGSGSDTASAQTQGDDSGAPSAADGSATDEGGSPSAGQGAPAPSGQPGSAAPEGEPERQAPARLAAPTAWDEAESPNYVRLVGSACIEEELPPGEVIYQGLDELGRTGQVRACITWDAMEAGRERERSSRLPNPSGWPAHNAEASVTLPNGRTYHGWFWNRSHLLAKSLGGSDERENLVTGTRMQNVGANDGQGGMDVFESAIRDWLDSYPDVTVQYVATPLYVGDELIPRSVVVDVRSSDGALDEELEVYNACKGYAIDYVTGSFEPS